MFFIAGAIIFHRSLGLNGVCMAVVAGSIGMVAVQLPSMYKRGFRYHFTMRWRDPDVVRYWKMFLPVNIGMSLSQVTLMVMPTVFGSMVGEGAVTSLMYANRMIFIPLGVFGSAVAMAISVSAITNMLILLLCAKTKLGLEIGGIVPMFVKTLLASAAMWAAGRFVHGLFHLGPQRFYFTIVLADFLSTALVSCAVFAGLSKVLKIEEFDEMLGMVVGRFRKTGAKKAGA